MVYHTCTVRIRINVYENSCTFGLIPGGPPRMTRASRGLADSQWPMSRGSKSLGVPLKPIRRPNRAGPPSSWPDAETVSNDCNPPVSQQREDRPGCRGPCDDTLLHLMRHECGEDERGEVVVDSIGVPLEQFGNSSCSRVTVHRTARVARDTLSVAAAQVTRSIAAPCHSADSWSARTATKAR